MLLEREYRYTSHASTTSRVPKVESGLCSDVRWASITHGVYRDLSFECPTSCEQTGPGGKTDGTHEYEFADVVDFHLGTSLDMGKTFAIVDAVESRFVLSPCSRTAAYNQYPSNYIEPSCVPLPTLHDSALAIVDIILSSKLSCSW